MKYIHKNKKGITPIIAVILLLMMTVAAAGAAFFWFVRIQGEMQAGTESYSGSLSEKMAAKVDVVAADVTAADTVTIFLQNKGNVEIPLRDTATNPTTTWILQDYEQKVICSSAWDDNSYTDCTAGCGANEVLQVNEMQRVVLSLSQDCAINSYSNGSVFYFVIDFSGKAATGGQFTK